jgi:hypothetical protein
VAPGAGFVEHPHAGPVDSASIVVREQSVTRAKCRPFAYAEGGPVMNGSFTGSGPTPSLNPQDYSQWTAGLGAGALLWDRVTIMLGYRYLRLNLRTPCIACGDKFVVNTNSIHSVVLRAGLHFGW